MLIVFRFIDFASQLQMVCKCLLQHHDFTMRIAHDIFEIIHRMLELILVGETSRSRSSGRRIINKRFGATCAETTTCKNENYKTRRSHNSREGNRLIKIIIEYDIISKYCPSLFIVDFSFLTTLFRLSLVLVTKNFVSHPKVEYIFIMFIGEAQNSTCLML